MIKVEEEFQLKLAINKLYLKNNYLTRKNK